jgi:methyltransferase (TIGR00027 family)
LTTGDGVLPPGVTRTALGVARIRAAETMRADGLFADPLAARFVAAAPDVNDDRGSEDAARAAVRRALVGHVIVRTRFFDDYLIESCAGGIRQVVLIAAGLDTRAFRLDWPAGVHVFELDLPELVEFKEGVLRATSARAGCERVVVPVDLRSDWVAPLIAAGFDPSAPTAWLVEGLLVYLKRNDAERLLQTVGECSAAGSVLGLESGDAAARLAAESGRAGVTELWAGGMGGAAADWLDAHGWQVTRHAHDEVARGYGRPGDESSSGFLTARRT